MSDKAGGAYTDVLAEIKKLALAEKQRLSDELTAYTGADKGAARWLPLLMGFFFTFALTVSSAWCVITAFEIPVQSARLALGCAAISLVFTLAAVPKKYGLYFAALEIVAALIALLNAKELLRAVRTVILAISEKYVKYGIGEPYDYAALESEPPDATAIFLAAACVTALLTAMVAMRAKSFWLALCLPVPMISICLNLLGEPPAVWCELLLCGALLMLLFVRMRSSGEDTEWALRALQLLPVLAALTALLLAICPPSTYERAPWSKKLGEELPNALNAAADKLGFGGETGGRWEPSVDEMDLSAAGPQQLDGKAALYVFAAEDEDGVYLRAASLDVYENNTWKEFEPYRQDRLAALGEPFVHAEYEQANWNNTLCVRTIDPLPSILTPYYVTGCPEGGHAVLDRYVDNPQELCEYWIDKYSTSDGRYYGQQYWDDPEYEEFVRENYTQIPDNLRDIFLRLAEKENIPPVILSGDEAGTVFTANRTADYIRSCATYDINTPQLPEGEELVTWFLENKRGYCMHFATAGTLMLRALGVPARFVTGYYVGELTGGEWTTVSDDHRHAWVEYYIPGCGWAYLECTGMVSNYQPPTGPNGEDGQADPTTTTSATTMPPPTRTETQTTMTESTTAAADEGQVSDGDEKAQPESGDKDKNSTQTGAGDGRGEGGSGAKKDAPGVWIILLSAALALTAAGMALRRRQTVKKRAEAYATGSANSRALARWHHIAAMSELLAEEPPRMLARLAEKAQFSQHELTDGELAQMEQYDDMLTDRLRDAEAFPKRLKRMFIDNLY